MCLRPITIRNPTKYLYKQGGQKLIYKVPCGQCAECVSQRRNEWLFRSYQQAKTTLSKGGYLYFDTLTYDNANLPHISDYIDCKEYNIKDFSTFNHEHFKLFLKRLRRQLEYHHGNNEFKYFLTSEYGTDDRFTHRPHYHIIFYITNGVNPLTFSKYVSECWSYGRTDGVPYKPISYVSDHIYGYDIGFGNNGSIPATLAVSKYVSKYVTKHSKFVKELEKRMYKLKCKIKDDEKLKELKRAIDMFHRQSQEFGLGYLYAMNDREIECLYKGQVIMEDSQKVVKTYPLPLYYKRKLFYENKTREDKTRYWEITDLGELYHKEQLFKSIDEDVKRLYDEIYNLSEDIHQDINILLDGRTLRDYCLYKRCYEGRSRDIESYGYNVQNPVSDSDLTDREYNLYDWLNLTYNAMRCNSTNLHNCYILDDNFVNTAYKDIYTNHIYYHDEDLCTFDKTKLFRQLSIDENSSYDFRNFDKLTSLLDAKQKTKRENKQKTFDYLEELKERFKNYGL